MSLQREVDTDRVPNHGVSGPCCLPNDLTAALANLSKTLREVVDGQMKYPWGVAVDAEHVYVADRSNHRVQVFGKADGAFVRKWGSKGDGDGQMKNPVGVAVDAEHVYVTDHGNNRVQVFGKADGAFVRAWGSAGAGDGEFEGPEGVAVDAEHVYVTDVENGRVQVFT